MVPPGSVVPMFLGCVWRSKMQRAYCNSRIWHPWRGSLLVGHSILIWSFYCTLQIEAITSKKSSLLNDCVEANPWLCSFIHSRKNMDTRSRTAWNPETSGWLGSKTIFTRVALRSEIKMVRRTVQSPRCRVYVVWGKQNSLAWWGAESFQVSKDF